MRIYLTFSAKRDPEMVVLCHHLGQKQFIKCIKEILRQVVRPGYVPKIDLPASFVLTEDRLEEKCMINLTITGAGDGDILALLGSVKNRMRPIFIKQCMKIYLGTKSLEAFFRDDFSTQITHAQNSQQIVYQLGNSAVYQEPRRRRRRVTETIPDTISVKKTATAVPILTAASITDTDNIPKGNQVTTVRADYIDNSVPVDLTASAIPNSDQSKEKLSHLESVISAQDDTSDDVMSDEEMMDFLDSLL